MPPQSGTKKKTTSAPASPVVFQKTCEQANARIPQKFLNSIGFINYDQDGNLPCNDNEAAEVCLSNEYKSITNFLGIDCEMVGVGHLKVSALGRVSIVNEYGYCIYDTFVDPMVEITDYRTKFSGIRPKDLEKAPPLDVVLQNVAKLVNGKTLVGHSIHNDLEVLKLKDHPAIRDTAIFFKKLSKERGTPSLKTLSKKHLKIDIQSGEHSSIQDAQATIKLYLLFREQWEQNFSQWRDKANIVAAKIPLTEISDMHVEPREPDLFVKSESVFVRANKVLGAYASCEEYLDIQFRLMLEDFLRPLRKSVKTANKRKKESKTKVYQGVRIGESGKGSTFEAKGKGKISVPIERNNLKDWEDAGIFIPGSLLLLSNDNFQSVKFAIITWVKPEDDCQDSYSLPIQVEFTKDGPTWIVNESDRFSMLESPAFFSAYRYTLEYLQVVNLNEFPMKKYIVDAVTTPVVPSHILTTNEKIEFSVLMKNGASHKAKPLEMYNWPATSELNLDSSQYTALKKALTQELTIIQGPPGTGKTYTTLQLVKLLLTNQWLCQSSPVLIVSYTNHALDQVLELILEFVTTYMCDGDEKEAQKTILRFGGGSESEKIEPLTLMHKTDQYKLKIRKLKANIKEHEKTLKSFKNFSFKNMLLDVGFLNFFNLPELILDKLLSDGQYKRIVEQLICWETEIRKNIFEWYGIDKDSLKDLKLDKGLFMLRCKNLDNVLAKGYPKIMNMVKQKNIHLEQFTSLQNHHEFEWGCYLFVVNQVENILKKMENELLVLKFNLESAKRFENRSSLLKSAKIVGMTTTGAVKYKKMVQNNFKPRIMIVEEAAHVLEAHVVASLTEHCNQMILIGDHKQLRPMTSDNELGETYQLNISLMERLVQNGAAQNNQNWVQLKHQHRMRPEIARMVCPVIYEELENHPVVYDCPDVPCCRQNLFFVNHNHPDEKEKGSSSYYNDFEAGYIINILKYFTQLGGYPPEKITIIATYLAQKTRIDNMLKNNAQLNEVRVSTVDGYQGEENDIILLSLVRSNKSKNVGFLKTDNRLCVALSRARHGLFMIGNMSCFENASPTWNHINKILKETESIGSYIPITIFENFKTDTISVASNNKPKEVPNISPPERPKTSKDALLQLNCEHKRTFSQNQLDNAKVIGKLPNCNLNVRKTLKCGHEKSLKCHQFLTYECEKTISKILDCGHVYNVPCTRSAFNHKCSKAVMKYLPCGHQKVTACHLLSSRLKCSVCADKNSVENQVPTPVSNNVPVKLPCGHSSVPAPDQPKNNVVCCTVVTKNLPCGHSVTKECHKFITYQCPLKSKRALACGHQHQLPCSANMSKRKCSSHVTKQFPCGHRKFLACHQVSPEIKCEVCDVKKPAQNQALIPPPKNVTVKFACGHSVLIPSNQSTKNAVCTTVVTKTHPCGHKVTKECHKVQVHQCGKSKMKNLKCGHQQKVRCVRNFSKVKCTTTVKKDLPCGHQRNAHCHQSSNSIKCYSCAITLPKESRSCDRDLVQSMAKLTIKSAKNY